MLSEPSQTAASPEELGRLDAPTSLTIEIKSNLAGVPVRVTMGPSHRDPLGQRGAIRHFNTLAEATDALSGIVTDYLREHHADAEAQRAKGREL